MTKLVITIDIPEDVDTSLLDPNEAADVLLDACLSANCPGEPIEVELSGWPSVEDPDDEITALSVRFINARWQS